MTSILAAETMKTNYFYTPFVLTLFCCVHTFSQNIIRTDRLPPGIVTFLDTTRLSTISDARHVDGYVKKIGKTRFIFPVGNNGSYRPFAANGNGVFGAYFQDEISTASIPAGGPFPGANKEQLVKRVAENEYWDINGSNSTQITLSWNSKSNISALTDNSIDKLTIVGWNTALGRWEQVLSKIEEVSIFGETSSLTSGSITTIQDIVPDKFAVYTLGSTITTITAPSYEGSLEVAGCSEITGWAWDRNYPGSALTVEILDGSRVIGTTIADIAREDLRGAGKGTGQYGFRFALPSTLMEDGVNHQVSVRIVATKYLLDGSPKNLNCGIRGNVTLSSCNEIAGWIWDKNNPSTRQLVELIEGNNVLLAKLADTFRQELKDQGVGDGYYGFSFPLPYNLRDGKPHQIKVRLNKTEYYLRLSGSADINFTCSPPGFSGSFEYADCNVVRGWVWDKLNPSGALTVELYEGTTVYATALA
ncbi:T9SS C-terminal target domain-containing protein, partial [Dyadobacter sp. CY261]|nr:T9SS C-terminal target domain-containing protein [Dyadobacter sp. CY261]